MRKIFMGIRLRRLREERGLTQAALAGLLGLSASYLNQLEKNQRPLTRPVLLRLGEVLGVDAQSFSEEEEARMILALQEVAADLPAAATGDRDEGRISRTEISEIAANMPAVGRAMIQLHRRHREALERLQALADIAGNEADGRTGGLATPQPYEEVRDFFFTHHNHFAELDEQAERCFQAWGLDGSPPARYIDILERRLREQHGVTVQAHAAQGGAKRVYDPAIRRLSLPTNLTDGQRSFQLGTQLALLEMGETLTRMADTPRFTGDAVRQLVRTGLANYFAAALILPYQRFLDAAENLRYDIDLLSQHFGVSFETICHRLSTMQRPRATGVPFFFIRVDRAGNVSKRQSAARFHFSRVGGTCPLWNVYEAFAHPGRILRQLARMPDGRVYLWIARTVSRQMGGYGELGQVYAVALGCDVEHAHRLVYAKGLDLHDPQAATPIGMGCRVCERNDCPQRAFPYIGQGLAVDENVSSAIPYLRAW
ncbi:short-chain fatty acyl-CoA regulator family protein [Achromobacter aloeverae]|uniref:Cro/Cl family transcriptional regulator n=1 Tax=Achromobacter aloeverae TaxID=1750518 RepID=A0A4V1MSA1_9BURK|nr:short-chain fatty acyl-CoA regulator family protein [Achromobacter aloeverae]RXN90592.1 Cro/Cl family transcriptional regulator [Achromobacter aloeverae]